MQNNNKTWLKHIDFLLIDIMSIFFSYCVSYAIWLRNLPKAETNTYAQIPTLLMLCIAFIDIYFEAYSGVLRRDFAQECRITLKYSFYSLVALNLLLWAFKMGEHISRFAISLSFIFHFIFSSLMKLIWKWHLVAHREKTRILIIGNTDIVLPKDYELVGTISDTNKDVCNYKELADYAIVNNINEVLIIKDNKAISKKDIDKMVKNGITVSYDIRILYPLNVEENKTINQLSGLNILEISRFEFSNKQILFMYIKRLGDIIFSFIGCIFLIPLYLFIKVAYLITGDNSPVIYSHVRVGKNGRLFKLYKFRTMIVNADEELKKMLKNPEIAKIWKENGKLIDDPRITKVGKFLRKTSLDEFPQFFNILIGDMSLIGPRPLIIGELESHTDSRLYWKVKPGLTGWWACNGRSNTNYVERLELEDHYIKNCSLELDIMCVLKTIKAVINKTGAI